MMARRNILLGRVHKVVTPASAKPPKKAARIAVLMGDPRMSDIIKPGSTWDEDDLHTVNEMKKVLATLPASSAANEQQVDLPLRSLALGEYVLRFTATRGDSAATTSAAFAIVR